MIDPGARARYFRTMHFHIRFASPLLLLPVLATPALAQRFYGDAPDATHPWAIHDANRPQPPLVTPGQFSSAETPGAPPSDAVVLFGGSEADLANWASDQDAGQPTKWIVKEGAMECVPGSGYVRTKAEWGDCQLHVEWAAPAKVEGDSQGRGNSGIFPMGQVEVQVLDNFNNPTYADGFAGSVYGVNPPMVNALRKPGDWQVYDIVFRRPVFKDGKELDPGYLTVFVNGILVQDNTPLEGGGGHRARSGDHPFPEKGPLKLQDHGNPVRYRNIWYRPLPARNSEGGLNGAVTVEAAASKKGEIANSLREDAAKKQGTDRLARTLESLVYQHDAATREYADTQLEAFVKEVNSLPADQAEAKKGEALSLNNAVGYMVKFKLLPENHPAKAGLEELIKAKGWDEKK